MAFYLGKIKIFSFSFQCLSSPFDRDRGNRDIYSNKIVITVLFYAILQTLTSTASDSED